MKNIIWLLVPLLLLSISAVAIAEGNETTQNQTVVLVNETTTQETIDEGDLNSTVTSTDVTMQQMRVWFTFNQEKKAERELELARLRLIQARHAEKHNDTTGMQKAMDAHEKLLDAVQTRMTAIKNKGGNITGLARAIQVHERRIEILNNILAKANLTEEQRVKIESRIAHAEEVTGKLRNLQEIKQQAREENKTIRDVIKENKGNKTKELNETEELNKAKDLNETEDLNETQELNETGKHSTTNESE